MQPANAITKILNSPCVLSLLIGISILMKLVHQQGGSKIAIVDVPKPRPGPNEVLVKTMASAVCGSEMGVYRKDGLSSGNVGHEAAGIVVELGDGVEEIRCGDHVGVSAIVGCGICDDCKHGRYTWCNQRNFIGNMHAEYIVSPARGCQRLPADISWDVAPLIAGDGLGVPYHTSTKIRHLDAKTIAVFGLGPIGLGTILVHKFLGKTLLGVDRSPERLKLAEGLGATVLAANEGVDVPAWMQAQTGGRGPDICVEAAGVPATVRACFASVRKGGTVVFNGEQPALELSPSEDFIRRDIMALGSWYYHFCEFPEMLALYRKGLAVESLVTHRFPLSDAAEAFRIMAEGKSGKVLLTQTPEPG
jgi:propanol-preferring alcohol dehydrogenase